MKKEATDDIKNLTVQELSQKVKEDRQKLFNLKVERKRGQLKNPLQIRNLRRNIARLLTLIEEKERKK